MSKKFLSPIKLAQGATVPATGSAGELFYNTTDLKVYSHNGTSWVAAGGGVTNSATAPTSPANGDVWFNTTEGTMFVYYSDGTSNQWVEATSPKQSIESYQIPAGSIMAWGGSTAPTNWMLADGTAVSRTTYASLFAAIGITYGSGDGSTTFNLPDLRGRVGVGKNTGTFTTLGSTGGAETHTLQVSEMPSHTHIQDPHTHSRVTAQTGSVTGKVQIGGSATTNDYFYVDATTATNQYTGGSGAHNNLQPYIVLNYIIKYSAGETPGDSELATRIGNVEVVNNATPLSPNYVINGALDYWQRSTSAAQGGNSSGYPSADRIRVISSGASSPAITLARSTDVPAGIGAQYSAAMSWSSNISGGDIILHHGIENGKFLFAGKTITVSFYAKASTAIQSKFDFDQDYSETFFNLTTSWARYSYTITLPSTYATSRPSGSAGNDNVEMRFIRFTSVSSASNTVYFTGLQVEEGSKTTPFRRSAPSLQAELAACQRYYEVLIPPSSVTGAGFINSATAAYIHLPFRVTKRASASVTYVGTIGGIAALWTGGGNAATNFTSPGGTDSAYGVVTTSGLSAGQAIMFTTSSAVRIVADCEI